MGSGGYQGGGTVVSPIKNPDWFSGDADGEEEPIYPPKRPIEMSIETEQEIASLRRSISALESQLKSTQRDLASETAKLRRILTRHGQPLDEGMI